jgi:hypothetical protein
MEERKRPETCVLAVTVFSEKKYTGKNTAFGQRNKSKRKNGKYL